MLWTLFVWNTSFELRGQRFFSLLDDSMISMRYARHLALGEGPVWNPGERPVEGFTNPATTAFMAVLHMIGLPEQLIALPVQAVGFLALAVSVVTLAFIVRGLVAPSHQRLAVTTYVVLVGSYVPILNWGLQGSETSLIAAGLAISLMSAVRAVERRAFTAIPYAAAGLLSLVRIDAVIPALAICLWSAARQGSQRRRHVLSALAWVGGSIVIQTCVRYVVFGEMLPNTYYLKLTGYPLAWRVGRGALVYWEFVTTAWPALLLGVLALRRPQLVPVGLVFLAASAYSIYCGGDAWEWWGGANRYLAPAFQLWLAATAVGIGTLSQSRALPREVALILAAVLVLQLNSFGGGRGLRVLGFAEKPLHAGDNRLTAALGLAIRECTDERAVIAVDWAGVVPYFAQRRTMDLLAKTDPVVARQPMHINMAVPLRDRFWPGHLKWDFQKSVVEPSPLVIVVLTGGYFANVDPFLADRYSPIAQALYGAVVSRAEEPDVEACLKRRMSQDIGPPMWLEYSRRPI